jgi:hypothetical protein
VGDDAVAMGVWAAIGEVKLFEMWRKEISQYFMVIGDY